jgi:hypothetical protein
MTGGAVLRRALEDGVDVARLARQVAVLTEELKPGRQVIELGAPGWRRLQGRHEQAAKQQREQRKGTPGAGRGSQLPD